ncbi:AAA family ATPase [Sorangium sp. So ce134]
MLTKLTLQGFRGFHDVTVALKPVTVIVGPNSSGKTSLLHATRLALTALGIALDNPTNSPRIDRGTILVCQNLVLRDHTRLMRVGEWEELFTSREVGEDIVIKILLEFDGNSPLEHLEVQLGYARNAVLKMSVYASSKGVLDAGALLPRKSKYRPQAIRDELRKAQPLAVLVPAFYGVTLDEEYRAGAVVNRMLEGGEQSRIVRNLVTRLKPAAFAGLNTFLKRTVGAELIQATSSADVDRVESLDVRFKDVNGPLELASAGAGLVNLIALYAAMERYREERIGGRSLVFLLDEPEAHLHPRLQGDIGVALADLAAEFGAQLMIATHSVEMINRLGQRDDTVLLHMDRAKSAARPLTSEAEIIRELGAWCDLSPFASLSFLSSRKVLFHEGPTDDEVLSRCAEAYFRSNDARLLLFRRWTFVELEGVSNADAARVLARTLTPKIFPALESGEKVAIVRVLDSDGERKAELATTSPAPHIQETRVVWSHYSIESLFLTPDCLVSWLGATLDGLLDASLDLGTLVTEALAAADVDETLQDGAIMNRARALRKEGVSAEEANKKAFSEVRQAPAVWQNGRERAGVVLKYIRDKLPTNLQNRVRGSIPKVLAAAPVEKLVKLDAAVPDEIRSLLDLMTKS